MKHTGVLHYCDLVQSCPPHLRRKGKRIKICSMIDDNWCDLFPGISVGCNEVKKSKIEWYEMKRGVVE